MKRSSDSIGRTQMRVLEFFRSYQGIPTIRKIQAELGMSSPSLVHYHLLDLEDKGFIVRRKKERIERYQNLRAKLSVLFSNLSGLVDPTSPISVEKIEKKVFNVLDQCERKRLRRERK